MDLTAAQTDILGRLRSVVAATPNRQILYCSEWLGYLPYGVYHWIEVDGEDISKSFPSGWGPADIEALERAELLERLEDWQNPDDEYNMKFTYKIS